MCYYGQMERYLKQNILIDLSSKIVLLTGPRQSGKTTLAKSLTTSYDYLNADANEDVLIIKDKAWDRQKALIIFDELHKIDNWKKFLKGVYDKEGSDPQLLVTGSAKLDTYKKVGDSLAGRYFQYRLYPLDLNELKIYGNLDSNEAFERLMKCSGFPEPYLSGTEEYYKRWQNTHNDIILRQDLIDYQSVRDIKSIEILVALLKQRVGSGVSFANLARDLERDPGTVKRWCEILENMYIVFRVLPYHDNIARSLLKEPKFYFFDICHAADDGARLENLVAFSLLKHLSWLHDTKGYKASLNYCRTKDGKEIDFMCSIEDRKYLIEVKTSDATLSSNFSFFKKFFQMPNVSS
jgi:predicted AAA+ superfamily ATPase